VDRRGAVAEDFRRVGVAMIVAGIVGGFFHDQVPASVTLAGLVLGLLVWGIGIRITHERVQ